MSLYGGGMFTADDYQAITTGIGFNLNQFGSLSLMSPEQTRLYSNKIAAMRGYSYRFNYAKHFESTGSQITFAGYRFR